MILLDTHIWVWWVQADSRLSTESIRRLDQEAHGGIRVSVFSCWEVAMLYYRRRLMLPCGLDEWIEAALRYPGVRLVGLSRKVAVESCRLPGEAPRDPADRILLATARELDCALVTADERVLCYPHARVIRPEQVGSRQTP